MAIKDTITLDASQFLKTIDRLQKELLSLSNQLAGEPITPKVDDSKAKDGFDEIEKDYDKTKTGIEKDKIDPKVDTTSATKGFESIKRAGIAAFTAIGAVAGARSLIDFTKEIDKTRRALTQFTNESGKQLNSLVGQVRGLTTAFGVDQQEVLNAANAQAKAFGITFEESLEQIKIGLADGADLSGEFLDSLREYPAFFAKAGLSADQTRKLLELQAKEGIYSDKGADLIKEATLRLTEFPKATSDALALVGIESSKLQQDIEDGNTSIIEAIQLITAQTKAFGATSNETGTILADVFGGSGEDAEAFLDVILQLPTATDLLLNRLERIPTATEKLADSSAKFNEEISALLGGTGDAFTQIQAELFEIGSQVIPAFKPLVDLLRNELIPTIVDRVLPTLKTLFDLLIPPIINLIDNLLPPLLSLVNSLIPVINRILQVIVPLVNEFVNKLAPVLSEIVEALLPVFGELLEAIADIITELLPPLIEIIREILPTLISLIESLTRILTTLIPIIVDVIKFLSSFASVIQNTILVVLEKAVGVIADVVEGFANFFGLIEEKQAPLKNTGEGLNNLAQGAVDVQEALNGANKELSDTLELLTSENGIKAGTKEFEELNLQIEENGRALLALSAAGKENSGIYSELFNQTNQLLEVQRQLNKENDTVATNAFSKANESAKQYASTTDKVRQNIIEISTSTISPSGILDLDTEGFQELEPLKIPVEPDFGEELLNSVNNLINDFQQDIENRGAEIGSVFGQALALGIAGEGNALSGVLATAQGLIIDFARATLEQLVPIFVAEIFGTTVGQLGPIGVGVASFLTATLLGLVSQALGAEDGHLPGVSEATPGKKASDNTLMWVNAQKEAVVPNDILSQNMGLMKELWSGGDAFTYVNKNGNLVMPEMGLFDTENMHAIQHISVNHNNDYRYGFEHSFTPMRMKGTDMVAVHDKTVKTKLRRGF